MGDFLSMKKNKILVLLVFLLLFIYLILPEPKEKEKQTVEEKRAIFVSYIELSHYLKGKDEAAMKNIIDDMIEQISDFSFNMILLQVRSFSDAIYPSTIFPSSSMIVEQEGAALPFDVLDYFIQKAHAHQIELHAWINPYRIRSSISTSPITEKNPAFLWLTTDKVKTIEGKGTFYNPASKEVEALVLDGIQEILDNYLVDGIHFDDYFYPDNTIDQIEYQKAFAADQSLTLQQYRLQVTSSLIQKVYRLVKKKNKRLLFGISPEGNIDNNYTSNYIDTKKFGKEKGYVDYLMPQIYFGFLNESRPFYATMEQWNQVIQEKSVMLIPALAFYKVGKYDDYAKAGANEWLDNNSIIMREVLASRSFSSYFGFAIFRYDSIFSPSLSQTAFFEKENLKSILSDPAS